MANATSSEPHSIKIGERVVIHSRVVCHKPDERRRKQNIDQSQSDSDQTAYDGGLAEQLTHSFMVAGTVRPYNECCRSNCDKIGDKHFKE